jgi:hypothetical protein
MLKFITLLGGFGALTLPNSSQVSVQLLSKFVIGKLLEKQSWFCKCLKLAKDAPRDGRTD